MHFRRYDGDGDGASVINQRRDVGNAVARAPPSRLSTLSPGVAVTFTRSGAVAVCSGDVDIVHRKIAVKARIRVYPAGVSAYPRCYGKGENSPSIIARRNADALHVISRPHYSAHG